MRLDHLGRCLGLLVSGALLLVMSVGCDLASISISVGKIDLERFDASETLAQEIPYLGQHIVLENLLGKVSVQGVETAVRPIIRIEAVKKVRGIKVDEVQIFIEQDRGEIRIRSDLPATVRKNLRLFPPHIEDEVGWVEFTLTVPQDAQLSLDQRAGGVEVSRFRGELEASTQLGDISVHDSTFTTLALTSQAAAVHVSTISTTELTVSMQVGDFELSEATFTSARVSAQAGGITVSGSQGNRITASTQAGSISLSRSQVERVDLETQAGDIELAVTGLKKGMISTQLGGIRVEFPSSSPLDLEAKTQWGGIKLHGLAPESGAQVKWGGSWPGQTLGVSFGNSQGQLELNAQLGAIEIQFTK